MYGCLSSMSIVLQNRAQEFLDSLQPRLTDGMLRARHMTLHFLANANHTQHNLTTTYLCVETKPTLKGHQFDFEVYKACLKTQVLGNTIIYADVLSSTMNIFDGSVHSLCPYIRD